MASFKRLTRADVERLTRAELLDRLEAESAYWLRKSRRRMTDEDRAGQKLFCEILHAAIDPGEALADARRLAEGRSAGTYWDEIPGDPHHKPDHIEGQDPQ